MKKESQSIRLISKELFFAFLVILLIILIYGIFQNDPGFGFFVPYWKKLTLLLSVTVFSGVLGVFWRRG